MDTQIFKKMKIKPDYEAMVLYAPPGYPEPDGHVRIDSGRADFVHLFVESREQFEQRFAQAATSCKESGVLWISYPKSKGRKVTGINRDSLWGLLLDEGYHPVAQVALDEEWSAVRVKRNEQGVTYTKPGNVKSS